MRIEQYYRKKAFRNRSMAGRAADLALFSAVVGLAVYILFHKHPFVWLLVCFAVAATLLLCVLFGRLRIQKTKERVRREAILDIQRDRLLLLPPDKRDALLLPNEALLTKPIATVADILPYVGSAAQIVYVQRCDEAVDAFLERNEIELAIRPIDALFPRLPSDWEEAELERRILRSAKPIRRLTRADWKALLLRHSRFLYLGLVLLVLSFITKYTLYLRILAAFCFVLSAISYILRKFVNN